MPYNNNLLIILGATLLGLLILVSSSVYYAAFAQQQQEEEDDKDKDDDKKEKDLKDKDEDDKEEEDDKDKEDNEKEEESKDDEEGEEQPPTNNNITQPQQNITEVINTTTAAIQPPPLPPQQQLDLKCNCTTNDTERFIHPPPPPPPANNDTTQQQEQQIIPISNINIKNFESYGDVTDQAYTDFYIVPNLLDNTIDDVSFWSQAGQSGFYIKLDSMLDNYQVCSIELNVHNPKNNVPYLLDIGVPKNYSGVIDQTTEIIQFDSCVKNMDEIYMTFDNPSNGFISIAEMKLFGGSSSTAASTNNIVEAAPTTIAAANKINIENSEAEIDIKNSTVTFKFDPLTATFVSTGSK